MTTRAERGSQPMDPTSPQPTERETVGVRVGAYNAATPG